MERRRVTLADSPDDVPSGGIAAARQRWSDSHDMKKSKSTPTLSGMLGTQAGSLLQAAKDDAADRSQRLRLARHTTTGGYAMGEPMESPRVSDVSELVDRMNLRLKRIEEGFQRLPHGVRHMETLLPDVEKSIQGVRVLGEELQLTAKVLQDRNEDIEKQLKESHSRLGALEVRTPGAEPVLQMKRSVEESAEKVQEFQEKLDALAADMVLDRDASAASLEASAASERQARAALKDWATAEFLPVRTHETFKATVDDKVSSLAARLESFIAETREANRDTVRRIEQVAKSVREVKERIEDPSVVMPDREQWEETQASVAELLQIPGKLQETDASMRELLVKEVKFLEEKHDSVIEDTRSMKSSISTFREEHQRLKASSDASMKDLSHMIEMRAQKDEVLKMAQLVAKDVVTQFAVKEGLLDPDDEDGDEEELEEEDDDDDEDEDDGLLGTAEEEDEVAAEAEQDGSVAASPPGSSAATPAKRSVSMGIASETRKSGSPQAVGTPEFKSSASMSVAEFRSRSAATVVSESPKTPKSRSATGVISIGGSGSAPGAAATPTGGAAEESQRKKSAGKKKQAGDSKGGEKKQSQAKKAASTASSDAGVKGGRNYKREPLVQEEVEETVLRYVRDLEAKMGTVVADLDATTANCNELLARPPSLQASALPKLQSFLEEKFAGDMEVESRKAMQRMLEFEMATSKRVHQDLETLSSAIRDEIAGVRKELMGVKGSAATVESVEALQGRFDDVRADVARFVLEKAEASDIADIKAHVEDRIRAMEKEAKRLSSLMFNTSNAAARGKGGHGNTNNTAENEASE